MNSAPAQTPRRRSLLKRPFGLLGALILAGGFQAVPAGADHVLEIARSTDLYRGEDPDAPALDHSEERGVLFLSPTRVRFDQGSEVSWILDTGGNKVFLVRHDLGVYHVFDVPLVLEDYATESERAMLEERSARRLSEIEVTESGETRQIDGYSARRVHVVGQSAEGSPRVEYELWLSEEVPGGEALYRAILREFGAADVVMRPLARRLAQLPGFPVLRRSVTTFDNGLRSIDERRLVSVAERPLTSSVYEPPAAYLEQPFSVYDWLSLR